MYCLVYLECAEDRVPRLIINHNITLVAMPPRRILSESMSLMSTPTVCVCMSIIEQVIISMSYCPNSQYIYNYYYYWCPLNGKRHFPFIIKLYIKMCLLRKSRIHILQFIMITVKPKAYSPLPIRTRSSTVL